jgi:hypothetical protein
VSIPSQFIRTIFLADLDLDGDLDVVGRTSSSIVYQVNTGAGSFAPPTSVSPHAGYPSPPPLSASTQVHAMSLGDLDFDGRPDVVAAVTSGYQLSFPPGGSQTTRALVWLHTQPGGAPGPVQWVVIPSAGGQVPGNGGLGVGDLDADGRVDAVHTTYNESVQFSFFLRFPGSATGGFLAPVNVSTSQLGDGTDASVVLADVTHDGLADALYAKPKANLVAARLGSAATGVGAESEFDTMGKFPFALAVADLDADGTLDLASCNRDSGNASILLSSGDGRFRGVIGFTAANIQPSGGSWVRVRATDVTREGFVDLVHNSLTLSGFLAVRAGGGDGTFGPELTIPGAQYADDFDWGDFDSDGIADLTMSHSFGGVLKLFQGGPLGTYGLVNTQTLIGVPRSLVVGDVNGDGKPDAVTSGSGSVSGTSLVSYRGNGLAFLPGVEAPTHASAPSAIDGTQKLALIDMSLDGFPEAASCVFSVHSIALQSNNGGVFVHPLLTSTLPATGPVAVIACDVNADGLPDLAAVNGQAPTFRASILVNNAAGGFLPVQVYPCGTFCSAIHAGDANGDGSVELFVVNRNSVGTIAVLVNNGSGAFSTSATFSGEGFASSFALADVDGSGRVSYLEAEYMGLNAVGKPISTGVFGPGTPGCDGMQGLLANRSPDVGASDFGITCTQTPASSLGLGLVTNAFDIPGSDPFFIGVKLHVDLFAASSVSAYDVVSDPSGHAFVNMPIANDPLLAGSVFVAQVVWAWTECAPSPLRLSSSRGLAFAILP